MLGRLGGLGGVSEAERKIRKKLVVFIKLKEHKFIRKIFKPIENGKLDIFSRKYFLSYQTHSKSQLFWTV